MLPGSVFLTFVYFLIGFIPTNVDRTLWATSQIQWPACPYTCSKGINSAWMNMKQKKDMERQEFLNVTCHSLPEPSGGGVVLNSVGYQRVNGHHHCWFHFLLGRSWTLIAVHCLDIVSMAIGGIKCVKYLIFIFNFILWVGVLFIALLTEVCVCACVCERDVNWGSSTITRTWTRGATCLRPPLTLQPLITPLGIFELRLFIADRWLYSDSPSIAAVNSCVFLDLLTGLCWRFQCGGNDENWLCNDSKFDFMQFNVTSPAPPPQPCCLLQLNRSFLLSHHSSTLHWALCPGIWRWV